MKQEALFRVPAHELLIEQRAAEFIAEIRGMREKAEAQLEEQIKHIRAFANRSIAQRRRFLRIRQLQESIK